MKKLLFIFIIVLNISILNAQYIDYSWDAWGYIDTANTLKPDVLNAPCENGALGYFQFYTECGDMNIHIVAQPFKVSSPTPLKSVIILGAYSSGNPNFVIDTTAYQIQILDATLNNVLYQVRYDTLFNNSNYFVRFREVLFDSTIVVDNEFYVAFTCGDTSYMIPNYTYVRASPYSILALKQDSCSMLNYKYDLPKIKLFGTNDWVYAAEVPIYSTYSADTKPVRSIAALLVFPRIDTAYVFSSSSNQSIRMESENDVTIFPNPTKNALNVKSNVLIKKIELVNPLGQALFKNNAINSYNYQINLENYPTGTYLIKVLTNSGQTTKKVIKE